MGLGMMKKITLIIWAFIFINSIAGCQNLKKIHASNFIEKYCEGILLKNSYSSSQYLGIGKERSYLEFWSATPVWLGGGIKILWTSTSELPFGFPPKNPIDVREYCAKH